MYISDCNPKKASTGSTCIQDCKGLADGVYQSCLGCHGYVTCEGGVMTDNQPCPGRDVWDDDQKTCANASTTCTSRCVGMSNVLMRFMTKHTNNECV